MSCLNHNTSLELEWNSPELVTSIPSLFQFDLNKISTMTCMICREDFCKDCNECLQSPAKLPCPCNEDSCNKCFIKLVLTTEVPCSDPDCKGTGVPCGNSKVTCPVSDFIWSDVVPLLNSIRKRENGVAVRRPSICFSPQRLKCTTISSSGQ